MLKQTTNGIPFDIDPDAMRAAVSYGRLKNGGPGRSINQWAHDRRAERQICGASGAWLALREKRRRAEMAAELDAAIMEFIKLHRVETDTVVLQAFQRWVRGAA